MLKYQNSKEAEFFEAVRIILITTGIYSISVIFNYVLHRKMVNKVKIKCEDLEIRLDQLKADVEKDEKEIKDIYKRHRKRDIFYRTRISHLRKEIDFWRDTIRKLLHNSKYEEQNPEKIIEIVTNNLKTYTTSGCSDKTIDEILYISDLISKAEAKEE